MYAAEYSDMFIHQQDLTGPSIPDTDHMESKIKGPNPWFENEMRKLNDRVTSLSKRRTRSLK